MSVYKLPDKAVSLISKARDILKKRYNECDSKGHMAPDKKENKCTYCYRSLGRKFTLYDSQKIQKSVEHMYGLTRIINLL